MFESGTLGNSNVLFVKFPCAKVIVWYPCLDEQQLSGLYQQAGSLGLQLLVAEFAVQTMQLDALEKSGAPGLKYFAWAEEYDGDL